MSTQKSSSVSTKIKLPNLYRVILHNDDKTPFDFVIELLIVIFGKNRVEANEITMEVHTKGSAVVGIYSKDIAETKVNQVVRAASQYEYPLKATYEVHG